MLDAMGIYQHHDAVTGTARQDVADDYAFRLSNAIASNNQAYGLVADQELLKLSGMTSNNSWKFCNATNSTFLDCPISTTNLTDGQSLFVGVHNPSSVNTKMVSLKTPDGHFNVSYWYYPN
jgi:hypothetical protein